MDCLGLIIVVLVVYFLFIRKPEGMASCRTDLAKGAYTSGLVDCDAERRYYTAIDDSNANPIVVDCAPDGTGCRYIDAPRVFNRWNSQI